MKYNLLLVVCGVLSLLPQTTQAYYANETGAQQINKTTAIYSISYTFGHPHFDFVVPATAERNATTTDMLGFHMMEDEGLDITADGTARGYIISSAPRSGDNYLVAAGSSHEFTLIVVHEIEHTRVEDYSVQVISLPFMLDGAQNKLQHSELRHYLTENITLNTESALETTSLLILPK